MVGDEDQSIFGYRGAYPKAMLNFKYAYTNAFVLKMKRNYRSGEEIVSAAHRFISHNKGRIDKAMVADLLSALGAVCALKLDRQPPCARSTWSPGRHSGKWCMTSHCPERARSQSSSATTTPRSPSSTAS